ncbi:hypothetical protein E4T66_11965 [Sinimarinibacterium sp. CAU 1509]|uniref:EcsC family protein n=1 Tax=Sinimarinibacterium sp. CAU 1509 TaxID=2562283 RepID=UPI0010ABC532|nr:EcsC family protein [Sinimarinibacterium sp. CAU 1509]TJY59892.1 hypothetical protein E4T66_11965 [Sinimarinibacterium sp. CAU 1509]
MSQLPVQAASAVVVPLAHLTPYEQQRLAEIRSWHAAPPDWGTRVMSRPSRVAAFAAQRLVPVEALRASLRTLDRLAGRVSGRRDVLRAAGAETLEQLAQRSLEQCDQLARRIERRAMLMAGAGGAALGVGGAVGMVADVPSLLTLALRTIHRSAYCYGEDWCESDDRALSIGVFALASANSMEEKQAAFAALRGNHALLDAAWRDGVERVAEREMAKDAAQFSMQALAARIGTHVGTRKAKGAVPVIGAVIGGAVNAGYIHDIAQVARYVLQERWLRRRYAREALEI